MQLIGMLDSPYVRRTAISLRLLGLAFEHKAVSVFSTFEQFQKINPVVKAPTLVCDDGEVLMDSTLIIQYAESLAAAGKSLMPTAPKARQHELRLIGLALAAYEKSVQTVYERQLRPVEKQHEPWLTRVRGQLLAAFKMLEGEVTRQAPTISGATTSQAGVTIAVLWRFTQMMVPETVVASEYPALAKFSALAEQLPAFVAHPPDGPGVPSN
jgi:glutathione S-transferase